MFFGNIKVAVRFKCRDAAFVIFRVKTRNNFSSFANPSLTFSNIILKSTASVTVDLILLIQSGDTILLPRAMFSLLRQAFFESCLCPLASALVIDEAIALHEAAHE
jgi:hypothetical protein